MPFCLPGTVSSAISKLDLSPVLAALLVAVATGFGAPAAAQEAELSLCSLYEDEPDLSKRQQLNPAWTGSAHNSLLKDLVTAIRGSASHGLNPQDYHLSQLEAVDSLQSDTAVDDLATQAYLKLADNLLTGRFEPVDFEPSWTAPQRSRDLPTYLRLAMSGNQLGASLDALAPSEPVYQALRDALPVYQAIAETGGWPVIDAGPELRPGDHGPRVAQLRVRLEAESALALPAVTEKTDAAEALEDAADDALDGAANDAADETADGTVTAPADPEFFDAGLQAAVEEFQRRARLEIDGRVGPATLAELNITARHRVGQIRANLERLRWLPGDMGRRHIRVNIPDFSLEARNDGVVERVHDVIVGLTYRPTPVFSASMTYMVVNPWWETPPSIAVRNELPLFRRDPDAVTRLGFQVLDRDGNLVDPATIDWDTVPARNFPYRLRQAPGPLNALGTIKLIFPNHHNVYLHDTSNRELFVHNRRSFSSGCLRLRDPLELAGWAITETAGETLEILQQIAAGNTETIVRLDHPIPVYVLYWTAVPDPTTGIRFVADLYHRDEALMAALESTPSPME